MRTIMLAGAAMMCFATAMPAASIAQDMPATNAPPAGSEAPPPPAAPPADPNAGQPTGSVPPASDMQPAPPGAPTDPSAPVGTSSNPVTMGGNMTPPPAEAKDYPLCSKTVQDSCINPSDARKAKKANRKAR